MSKGFRRGTDTARPITRSLAAISGRFSGKFRQRFRHELNLWSRAHAGIIQDGKDGINGKAKTIDALERGSNAR